MFEEQTISDGDCVDNDYMSTLFNNLRVLRECSRENSEQFTCQFIELEQSGSVRIASSTEMCFDLQTLSGTVNPNSGASDERKMLIFTRESSNVDNLSDSSNARIGIRRSARIVCNGNDIKTITDTGGVGNIVISVFECPSNSDVQLCFDSQYFTVSGQPGLVSGTQNIRLCAALVCIKDIQNGEIEGYFMPPSIPEECKLGREALHLASQNATALRSQFENFGQIASTESYSLDNDGEVTVEFNSPTVMDFLVIGTAMVAGRNESTISTASLVTSPFIDCGSTRINCISVEGSIPPAENGGGVTRISRAPILGCGQCQPGDNLVVGLNSQVICNEDASTSVNGASASVVNAEQNFCVFKFRRLQTDFGDSLNRSIDRCIDVDRLQDINDTLTTINQLCESQEPIELDALPRRGLGIPSTVVDLSSASPWPPLDEPTNTNPPPIRRYFLSMSVFPCVLNAESFNREDRRVVRATAIITCGGVEIARQSTSWTLTSSGAYRPCGNSIDILECVECPINENLRMTFEGDTVIGAAPNRAPNSFSYEGTLIGF